MSNSFFNSFRSFFGLPVAGDEPKNDFRNPIWGSDDEDDDDDELYHKGDERGGDLNITIYTDPTEFNRVMSRQVQDMLKSFSGMMGDVKSFFEEDQFALTPQGESYLGVGPAAGTEPSPDSSSIRDHYLKPGYNAPHRDRKEDIDLDGKISSQEMAGLLKQKDFLDSSPGRFGEGRSPTVGGSFFQTIITQSVTKPDGTIETRRIVKDHLGNVEETVTTSLKDAREPEGNNSPIAAPFLQPDTIFKDFASLWKVF